MPVAVDYSAPVSRVPLPLYPEVIPDWRPKKGISFVPTITPVFPEHYDFGKKHGMVIVAPGGGYNGRAEHERTPFAELFAGAGMASAILDYRTAGECETPLRQGPLNDARRALRIVRAHADAWGVDKNRIALLGFSAGGHLTSSAGVHFVDGDPKGYDAAERVSSRPDAIILAYAVIHGDAEEGHVGTKENLVGKNPAATDEKWFDTARNVTEKTPPTFFFHTANDGAVPVEGALHFATALRKAKVPFEMHVYPDGPHGVGLAKDRPALAGWTDLTLAWLRGLGY